METVIKTDRTEKEEPTEFFNWNDNSVLEGVYLGIEEGKGHKIANKSDNKFTYVTLEESATINEALKEVKPNFESVKIECLPDMVDESTRAFEISRVS